MVGKIHPVGTWTPDLPFAPLVELVWVAWDRYHNDHDCVVCKNIREWVLDLIWEKWDHKKFIIYNEFIYKLIYTNTYDKYMNQVATCDMPSVETFFYGWIP